MTESGPAPAPGGLASELSRSLSSLWARYAGKPPRSARTEISGDVVTCVLVDAVADYERGMRAPQARGYADGAIDVTAVAYRREAIAAVVEVTRRRVVAFVSSHDRDTNVATEVFTLGGSLMRQPPHPGGDPR
ncbi:MAG TPA: Na-translocating system protein MpsC family protein [Solirubrobacterales bacterium]|nr:Na-translocating system protein MpsC family protein [Solirubrobacterales bacterium]